MNMSEFNPLTVVAQAKMLAVESAIDAIAGAMLALKADAAELHTSLTDLGKDENIAIPVEPGSEQRIGGAK